MIGNAPSSLICWTDFFAIVGFVTGDSERRPWRFQHIFDDLAVVDVPTRHDEVERTAFAVDKRVDFGRAAAATDTDGLIFLPPFAPLARGGLS